MIGIIGSVIALLITIVLRITLGTLTDKFEFLASWFKYFNYIIIGLALIVVIFVLIAIIQTVRNKKDKD